MNGRKAKALRREAESYTTGQPAVRYIETDRGRKLIDCTRAAYQQLKRESRQSA